MNDDSNLMRVAILSSGSSGNVAYIQTNQHQILLDAGLSGIKIRKLLKQIDRSVDDIDMLFISHEHSDHSRGMGVLARRCPKMQVFANQETWDALPSSIGKIPESQRNLFPVGTIQTFGELTVQSFGVSHDAASEQCYLFKCGQKRFVLITDTGYISETIQHHIQNSSAFALECNYDVEMLMNGPYPWPLKQRIICDTGHMSNEDEGEILAKVIGNATKAVFLTHRSHHNNTRLVAHQTIEEILTNRGFNVEHDFHLYDTDVCKPTKLINL
ncbi:MBL fold metallo-hydrolase [Nicoliella spurrieriana]|uniref:MBL fold metallo-hydrolase n=1 Tax=Nicoliella spurrieriana TaxID=2925830 RepID=A0A976RSX6_9LACO|nr:MBL fold metallo-hydrolase [Nicoliella spurrieriana]UQS87262.1 MBL fold metallo-hydrolase [Nicoliella spurrieriana]